VSKLNKKIDILGETKENIIKILRRLKLKEMNEKTPFDYLINMSFHSMTIKNTI
jgi:hypothetical protein|tara:strand:- start:16 stop:177 length:162 start_codon:yes stop_codon:yes gene_type:complete